MTLNNVTIAPGTFAENFARHFSEKIKSNSNKSKLDANVYNGKCKLIVACRNFMTRGDVENCLNDLGSKKCEGYDRIPVCTLYHARIPLLEPMVTLFENIYKTKKIPEQWKIAKIIPIFKKGSKNKIENYRPIANLCSASKIFEKLILKQIHYLENTNKLDLTGKQQHGFKRNKSTATAGALLQSLIARAADSKCYFIKDTVN